MNNTIAVIEDNDPIRKLFCTILKKTNFEIDEFANAETALVGLREKEYVAIIMDILLPDINGTDLIGEVRKFPNCKDTPIIAVTGFALNQDKQKFLDLGFDAYIAKPVNTAAFTDEVKDIINSKK